MHYKITNVTVQKQTGERALLY